MAPAALLAAVPPCESLTELTLPDTVISSATAVAAGPLTLPGARSAFNVPAFCRVPPAATWNGKFQGTGNGGFSSALEYNRMVPALNSGYATAGSDTGHQGGEMTFGVGHPEKINDWAYRATHTMTTMSQLIVRDYYGSFAKYSYFNGCSTGGQEALSEAQRFPNDYDGILAATVPASSPPSCGLTTRCTGTMQAPFPRANCR
jgi:feruloyl esterase